MLGTVDGGRFRSKRWYNPRTMTPTALFFAALLVVSASQEPSADRPRKIASIAETDFASQSEIGASQNGSPSTAKTSLRSVLNVSDIIRENLDSRPLRKVLNVTQLLHDAHRSMDTTPSSLPREVSSSEVPTSGEDDGTTRLSPGEARTNLTRPTDRNQQIELEISKPLSISREQLVRFRKFLNKKGIVVKHPEDDIDEEVARFNMHPLQK